jgi:membrane protease YdiL (CAAX protease family)
LTPLAAARRPVREVLDASGVAVAMVVFALLAHRGLPWVAVGGVALVAAAALIADSLRGAPWPPALPEPPALRSRVVPAAAVAIVLGAIGGILQRQHAGVVPETAGGPHLFVALACLIGVTEELVYRGWMLGRLSKLGWPAAVAGAALAHAAYKTALFAWPPPSAGAGLDLAAIAAWTLGGGLVLGILRVTSRSVLPAVLAHAVFDAVVYSAFAAPPWWVWG